MRCHDCIGTGNIGASELSVVIVELSTFGSKEYLSFSRLAAGLTGFNSRLSATAALRREMYIGYNAKTSSVDI